MERKFIVTVRAEADVDAWAVQEAVLDEVNRHREPQPQLDAGDIDVELIEVSRQKKESGNGALPKGTSLVYQVLDAA